MSKKILFALFGLLIFNQFAWAYSSEDLKNLNELKEKLRKEKLARVNDKVDSYNQIKSLEMKVYSLEDRVTDLKKKKIDLGEKLYTLEQEKEKIESEYYELETKAGDLRRLLLDKCETLKYRIENSFPYKKEERLEKVNSLITSIKKKGLALEKGLAQFFNILEEELTLGETSGLYSEKIEGKEIKILKVGGIFLAYKSKDEEIGFLEKRAKRGKIIYRWNKNIRPPLRKKMEEIFQGLEKGGKKLRLPLDVTQGTKSREIGPRGGLWGWIVRGGPVMIPIGALALAILIMVVERFLTFRREHTDADKLMEKVMKQWSKGLKAEALKFCETTPGPVARMLLIGLEQHQKGKKVVEESLHEQHLEELPRLEKYLSVIGVLAAAAPLLGLLGTVSGMISTFQVITYYGGGDPRLLAGGISEALITTQAGLIIAIPALLLHNYLSNRADKIASDMEKNAVKLINSLPD
jgi:biopolymer transport protein ExbB